MPKITHSGALLLVQFLLRLTAPSSPKLLFLSLLDTVISKDEFLRYRKNVYKELHEEEMPEDVQREIEQEVRTQEEKTGSV